MDLGLDLYSTAIRPHPVPWFDTSDVGSGRKLIVWNLLPSIFLCPLCLCVCLLPWASLFLLLRGGNLPVLGSDCTGC